MRLPAVFKRLATILDDGRKCGFCWTFRNAFGDDGMNTIRIREEEKCCVHLVLTWQKKVYNERRLPDNLGGGFVDEYCDHYFTLYAVQTTNLGTNYGDEIPYHEDFESISESIVEPLFECLTCDNVFYWCELEGDNLEIKRWDAEVILHKGDQNFSGLRINGVFRQKILQ